MSTQNPTLTIDGSSANNSMKRNGGGVADYFAILGIGETLELKSTQKKYQRVSTNAEDENERLRQREALLQEEECSMVERFYREIVEVSIFTAYSDRDGMFVGGSLATSISAGVDDGSDDGYDDEGTMDFEKNDHGLGGGYDSKGRYQISSIVPSPTKLAFRKRANNDDNDAHLPGNVNTKQLLPKEISGFHILYQTTATGQNSNQNNDPGINQNTSGMSYATDNDISMNTSLPQNTTTDTIDLSTQSLDADLNPATGLLSSLYSFDKIPQDLSFTNLSFESQPDQESWNRINFRRNIPKRLREQISPILATKAKAVVGECMGNEGGYEELCRHYYIGFRKRGADETDKPAVADLLLMYCRVDKSTIIDSAIDRNFQIGNKIGGMNDAAMTDQLEGNNENETSGSPRLAPKTAAVLRRGLVSGASLAKRVATSGKNRIMRGRPMEHVEEEGENEQDDESYDDVDEMMDHESSDNETTTDKFEIIHMHEVLNLPQGFENGEWIIPCSYQSIKMPLVESPPPLTASFENEGPQIPFTQAEKEKIMADRRMRKTYLFNHRSSPTWGEGAGVEAFVNGDTFIKSNINELSPDTDRRNPWSPVCAPPGIPSLQDCKSPFRTQNNFDIDGNDQNNDTLSREALMPLIISHEDLPSALNETGANEKYEFIPIVAVRRQRIGEEERFHEDPGIIDIAMTLSDRNGKPAIPEDEEFDEFDDNEEDEDDLLRKSKWSASDVLESSMDEEVNGEKSLNILPAIIFQRNLPSGFVDTPFATGVLDRFPQKDYKGVPLPEEELPMFCYPTGCRLFRARYQDAPLAEYYGFVVKNERGDNIHVSCVSFMEPLESSKVEQLDQISEKKRRTSLAHKRYCEKKERSTFGGAHINDDKSSFLLGFDDEKGGKHLQSDMILTGFDEMMTFELKTICLVSRYPFWSAFRRFLSHLHILSGSSSELPLERYISHLLLAVPIPKPGCQCILLPLPAIASPMVLNLPPAKDLPLLDLPCHRLFSCLDVPTVVTIVLGFLALERKVIIMSSYPSLVSDVCEILRTLLFPFELCAPYVPRLTSPFMSCLQFPGAIFVGIHDDGYDDGLAATVRREIPEDSLIVDLDTGDIDCNGDRYEVLKECWDIIPSELRSLLVEEIETLCQDARLVPGQEPLGIEIEAALDVSVTPIFGDDDDEILDDRAVRDCFLRFFCSILGGYERFLVVPDMDFVISGNEWFDTKGFLNATKSQSRSAFLNSFVTTQLFQSFIQRRTEASDVRCLLFDECLAEFHSSKIPYGRLSRYIEAGYVQGNRQPYDLLVDQCASEIYDCVSEGDETSSAEASILTAHTIDGFMMINNSGDFVTAPSRKDLPVGMRYVYCIDGHPHFPQKLDVEMFYPKEPECLSADLDKEIVPILTRSDREADVSKIRRKLAVTHRGVQRQRRCLFQLPKVMASHFLNSWLMCIPSQVSQQLRSSDQQQSYILRALGALRTLRSRQRIVPDEAGYRCLIVACGRADSDRRQELVRLFGLLRSDGIFPSAVTLGQYTRAIAEGFSKRSCGNANSSIVDQCSGDEELIGAMDILDAVNPFDFLDSNLVDLEESGKRWRSNRDTRNKEKVEDEGVVDTNDKTAEAQTESSEKMRKNKNRGRKRRRQHMSWSPVTCSSSFSPHWKPQRPPDESFDLLNDFRFIALWSRTTICHSCSHTLLDEEVQAGWDEVNPESEASNEIRCPSCGTMVQPQLGYNEMSIERVQLQSMHLSSPSSTRSKCVKDKKASNAFDEDLPPQLQSTVETNEGNDGSGTVPYLNPSRMRKFLEEIVEESGEEALERETLRYLSPVVFFNLWWYCCRFSLPLPLAVSPQSMTRDEVGSSIYNCHCCAFAAWDKSLALAGCRSGAKAVRSVQALIRKRCRPRAAPYFQNLVKSFDAPSSESGVNGETPSNQSILSEDFPLLSNLNLQSLAQGDWDNSDLSAILVNLVEACDKRDFLPALKAVLQCNINRRTRFGRQQGVELECYQTLLYLTRYQCMSAFHKFFPATCRVCKGYHFWCPHTTVTIFDRMFREASDRLRAQGNSSPILDVSDVALGFRSVFGHMI